jgi:hypothetical protein
VHSGYPRLLFLQARESRGSSPLPPTIKINLPGFWLSEVDNKRYHSTQYQEDAHQIIEDFRKNHYDDTEDKGNDSSNEP